MEIGDPHVKEIDKKKENLPLISEANSRRSANKGPETNLGGGADCKKIQLVSRHKTGFDLCLESLIEGTFRLQMLASRQS